MQSVNYVLCSLDHRFGFVAKLSVLHFRGKFCLGFWLPPLGLAGGEPGAEIYPLLRFCLELAFHGLFRRLSVIQRPDIGDLGENVHAFLELNKSFTFVFLHANACTCRIWIFLVSASNRCTSLICASRRVLALAVSSVALFVFSSRA